MVRGAQCLAVCRDEPFKMSPSKRSPGGTRMECDGQPGMRHARALNTLEKQPVITQEKKKAERFTAGGSGGKTCTSKSGRLGAGSTTNTTLALRKKEK